MPEQEITEILQSGSETAFRQFVEKYQKQVLNCAWRFTHDVQAAEDITQEVFIAVFTSGSSFRGEATAATWLYRITVNLSLNYNKRLQRKKRAAKVLRLFGPERAEDKVTASSGDMPDAVVENAERARVLAEALRRLPKRQLTAFTLFHYSGLSYAEVAEVLETGVPATEALLNRARANLKKMLENYYKKSIQE